ncbi:MAG TPA: NUDIX hydrolase [Burkholderiaceae bacterium]|nr:NUDIX hydrolase [Burkholderiaceae bacterium]
MKFCSNCAHPVSLRVPDGDNRLRVVCDQCGTIHYENPRIVVGTLPIRHGQVLLCKRAIEPRSGYWTLPAGFLECGESVAEGAARETEEEAGIDITLGPLFSVVDVPFVNQVHMFYLAEVNGDRLEPGPETLEAALFDVNAIPWETLAFRTVAMTLRWYLDDPSGARQRVGPHSAVVQAPAIRELAPAHPDLRP